jgi:hypothetical protein
LAADSSLIEEFVKSDEIAISKERNSDFLMKGLSSWL